MYWSVLSKNLTWNEPVADHIFSWCSELGSLKADRLVWETAVSGHVTQMTVPVHAWHVSRTPLAMALTSSPSTFPITPPGRKHDLF